MFWLLPEEGNSASWIGCHIKERFIKFEAIIFVLFIVGCVLGQVPPFLGCLLCNDLRNIIARLHLASVNSWPCWLGICNIRRCCHGKNYDVSVECIPKVANPQHDLDHMEEFRECVSEAWGNANRIPPPPVNVYLCCLPLAVKVITSQQKS